MNILEKQKRILAQIKPDLEKVIDAEQEAATARAEKAARLNLEDLRKSQY